MELRRGIGFATLAKGDRSAPATPPQLNREVNEWIAQISL